MNAIALGFATYASTQQLVGLLILFLAWAFPFGPFRKREKQPIDVKTLIGDKYAFEELYMRIIEEDRKRSIDPRHFSNRIASSVRSAGGSVRGSPFSVSNITPKRLDAALLESMTFTPTKLKAINFGGSEIFGIVPDQPGSTPESQGAIAPGATITAISDTDRVAVIGTPVGTLNASSTSGQAASVRLDNQNSSDREDVFYSARQGPESEQVADNRARSDTADVL